MRMSTFVSAIAFGVLVSGAAYALDAAAPAATSADAAARAAKSVECYKEADVKGLHGKERRKFHTDCMKGG